MKTLEVMEKVLKAKRRAEKTKTNIRLAFKSLAEYSEEWPESPVIFNEWLASLERYSDTSVKLFYRVVRAGSKYMRKAYGMNDVFEFVEVPKVEKKRRRYFTAEELIAIMKACKNEFERLLICVLIDSGCRIGELSGLKVEQVGDGVLLLEGKTGQRSYRCDRNLCKMLLKLAGDSEHVFGSKTANSLGLKVRSIIERAGIKGIKLGPHTIRHSVGNLVAAETGSVLAVKAILQHDNQETSMVYIHDVDDVLQQQFSP